MGKYMKKEVGAWHSLDSDYNIYIYMYILNNINKA